MTVEKKNKSVRKKKRNPGLGISGRKPPVSTGIELSFSSVVPIQTYVLLTVEKELFEHRGSLFFKLTFIILATNGLV